MSAPEFARALKVGGGYAHIIEKQRISA